MAEAAGLVVGGVALASLFTTCVDCFKYIQYGRHFGDDYQLCLLQLDIYRLRLTRWGEAVKINESYPLIIADDDGQLVKDLLDDILERFKQAEKISQRFEGKMKREKKEDKLSLHDSTTDLTPTVKSLHGYISQKAESRGGAKSGQKKANFLQKTAWALYEKEHFTELVTSITSLVKELVEISAPAQPIQRQLCTLEISEIPTESDVEKGMSLLALQDIVKDGADPLLKETIEDAKETSARHIFEHITLEQAKARLGNEYANTENGFGPGMTYAHIKIVGGDVHLGNRYGYE